MVWWLILAAVVSGCGGFGTCAILVANKEDALRSAIRKAFDLGHELGSKQLNYLISVRKFFERFGEL